MTEAKDKFLASHADKPIKNIVLLVGKNLENFVLRIEKKSITSSY